MNQPLRTPKSVYAIFAGGLAVGAISVAGVLHNGLGITPAEAQVQQQTFKPRAISAVSAESMAELHNMDASLVNLAKFASPAVVDIKSTNVRQTTADGRRMPMMGGEGSGFIFRPDGYIITNDHVVGGFDNVTVTLTDGREFKGKVTRAADSDIALVKIDANNLPTLSFGDSSKIEPGQMCMAIGAPFGLQNSVTVGHISALGRDKTVIEDRLYPDLIQTDTAINMGNSGGPLVNVDGQVIGINTAIFSQSGMSAGIGFAIPSNQAKFIADQLTSKGKVTRSMIGLIPDNLSEYQKQEKHVSGGALVTDVVSDPAKSAGLQKGDIITKIGDTVVTNQLDLRNAMLIYAPDTTVKVEYIRDGQAKSVDLKLKAYKRPAMQQQQQFAPRNGMPFQFPKNFGSPFGGDPFQDMPGFPKFQGGQGGQDDDDATVPPVHEGRARLGVSVQDVTGAYRQQYGIPTSVKGAVVLSVQPGSVAANLGLQEGDVIQRLGDHTITSAKDLTDAIKDVKWGNTRTLKFTRYTKNGFSSSDSTVTFK